jgi:hypothetical protein
LFFIWAIQIDWILVANSESKFGRGIVKVYKGEKKRPVVLDEEDCRKSAPKVKILKTKLGEYLKKAHLLRHNPDRLALEILKS